MNTISDAAKASGISPAEAVQNIQSGFQQNQSAVYAGSRESSSRAAGAQD
jgi:hypothetical protein